MYWITGCNFVRFLKCSCLIRREEAQLDVDLSALPVDKCADDRYLLANMYQMAFALTDFINKLEALATFCTHRIYK